MKRIVIMLALLLAILVPAALSEGRVLSVGDDEYISGMLADGDTLYVLCDDNLYLWRAGDEALTALTNDIHLPEDRSPVYFYEMSLYADGDGLHGLYAGRDDVGDISGLKRLDLALTDDGRVEATAVESLPLPSEIAFGEYYGSTGACAQDGKLVLLFEGGAGIALVVMDPEHPGDVAVQDLNGWDNRLLSTDGGVLLSCYEFEEEGVQVIYRVGSDGDLTPLCRLPGELRGIAADRETGAVYAVVNGKAFVVDPETGEQDAPFGALPMRPNAAAALSGGQGYALAMGTRVAVLDPAGRLDEDHVLTVYNEYPEDWLVNAALNYSVAHPELPVALMDEGRFTDQILGDMLAKNPEPDIYVLYWREAPCQAMLERGYVLPLEGSAALEALAERVYPGVGKAIAPDGTLLAVPVGEQSTGMGVSPNLLEKLGLTLDDVPRDWPGFLNFLEEQIKPNLDALEAYGSFTYDDMTENVFRQSLLESILNGYVTCAVAAGRAPEYDDPALLAALEKLDGMDLSGYGLRRDEEDSYDFGFDIDVDAEYLIQFNMSYDFQFASEGCEPVLLGFGDDLPGVLPLDLQVALVNPFSPRAAEAVALLEEVAEQLPDAVRYAFCPDLNEPVEQPDAERTRAYYQREIDAVQTLMDRAEPAEQQALQAELDEWQAALDDYNERWVWLIPREKLDWYRANGDAVAVQAPSWFEKDASGEAWDLMEQYLGRQISAREFLDAVSRKARMLEMEG